MIAHIDSWMGRAQLGQQPANVRTSPRGMPRGVLSEQNFYSNIYKTSFRRALGRGGEEAQWEEDKAPNVFYFVCLVWLHLLCLFVWNQINMCSSPESHCVHGAGSCGDSAEDHERRLNEAFV